MIWNWFSQKHIKRISRDFNKKYLLSESAQLEFEKKGYTVLHSVVTNDETQQLLNGFNEISKHPKFILKEKFESSGNFLDKELQKNIFSILNKVMTNIVSRIANLENCEVGDGGAFFIKPSGSQSELNPHQDSAVIDESKFYGMFLWTPLTECNSNTGTLSVMPGSHLFGNHYRAQHIPWAFKNQIAFLKKHMIEMPVSPGDLICFDTSLIHGSGINKSESTRIAACGALLPKNHSKVEYQLQKRGLLQYHVENEYWLDGGNPENLSRYPKTEIQNNFPNPITRRQLKKLIYDTSIE